MTLSENEKVLCIAALEHAAKDLTDGVEASIRLKHPADVKMLATTAQQMLDLKSKLEAVDQ